MFNNQGYSVKCVSVCLCLSLSLKWDQPSANPVSLTTMAQFSVNVSLSQLSLCLSVCLSVCQRNQPSANYLTTMVLVWMCLCLSLFLCLSVCKSLVCLSLSLKGLNQPSPNGCLTTKALVWMCHSLCLLSFCSLVSKETAPANCWVWFQSGCIIGYATLCLSESVSLQRNQLRQPV